MSKVPVPFDTIVTPFPFINAAEPRVVFSPLKVKVILLVLENAPLQVLSFE